MSDTTKIASNVVDSLKSQPLALALVVVNVLWLIGGGWFMREENKRQDLRRAFVEEVLRTCLPTMHKPD